MAQATDGTGLSGTKVLEITVVQANPTVTWANPADIVYGTALSAVQLDATASVPGRFAYSPPAGTVLHAGGNQKLSVTFTPTDTVDYAIATAAAKINVARAKPTITWADPANIATGTPLGATQLNAKSPVSGVFTYTPASGSILSPGANQEIAVSFRRRIRSISPRRPPAPGSTSTRRPPPHHT